MRERVLACVLPNLKKCIDSRLCVRFDIESEIALDYHVRTLRKLVYQYEHTYTIILPLPLIQIGGLMCTKYWQSAKMKILFELMLKVPVNS